MSETREKLISIPDHGNRLKSIDALRGFVMVIMLLIMCEKPFICIDGCLTLWMSSPVQNFSIHD